MRAAEFGPARDCEADLIGRLQQRDPLAIDGLYDLYGSLVYSVILRMVHDAAIAQDLVQETFLRVWTRAGLFDAKRALLPWLLSVARNRAIDYLRCSGGRWNRCEPRLHETEDPKGLAELERSILTSYSIRKLSAALEKLSLNQRTVINLAYFEDYSQAEMAVKLGIPIGTIKTRVRGALTIIREELLERVVAVPKAFPDEES